MFRSKKELSEHCVQDRTIRIGQTLAMIENIEEKKVQEAENVKVHHIHRVKNKEVFCCRPKMSRGVLFDRGNRKRLKVSRSRAFDTIETATRFNFCWQSNDKRSVQPWGVQTGRASGTDALYPLCPMAALPRVFCCSEIREWNDPALIFWLCVVSCLVVREEKGKLMILGKIEVICQRKIKGPRGRQLVHNECSGVARGKKRARKWR